MNGLQNSELEDSGIAKLLNKMPSPRPPTAPSSRTREDDRSRRSMDILGLDLSPLSCDINLAADIVAAACNSDLLDKEDVEKMHASPRYNSAGLGLGLESSGLEFGDDTIHTILEEATRRCGPLDDELQALVFGEENIVAPPPAKNQILKSAPMDPEKMNKQCRCLKSKCLKLYCECFAANVFCGSACKCTNCHNNEEHEDTTRKAAMAQKLEKRPEAFDGKVKSGRSQNSVFGTMAPGPLHHVRGCNCKRSGCRKKYCECYQNGVNCGEHCKCKSCKNKPSDLEVGSKEGPFGCFNLTSTPAPVTGPAIGALNTFSPRHFFTLQPECPKDPAIEPAHSSPTKCAAGLDYLLDGTECTPNNMSEAMDQDTPAREYSHQPVPMDTLDTPVNHHAPDMCREDLHGNNNGTDMLTQQEILFEKRGHEAASHNAHRDKSIKQLVHDGMFARTPTSGTIVKKRRGGLGSCLDEHTLEGAVASIMQMGKA